MPDTPGKLNLYVVGESSPNPDDWSPYSSRKLVIAESPEAAIALAEHYGPATPIPMDTPVVLMSEDYDDRAEYD